VPEPDPDKGRTVLGVVTDSSDADNDDAVEPKEQALALFPVDLPFFLDDVSFLEEKEEEKKLGSFMVAKKDWTRRGEGERKVEGN
jgi:hypothetical protein